MAQQLPPITISPGPDPVEEDGLTIPSENDSPPVLPDVASQRASKTVQGFGTALGEKPDIERQILDGQEAAVRQAAASKKDFDRVMQRQEALKQLANRKQGPLTFDDVQSTMDPFNNPPADPDMVIERAFSDDFISSLNTAKSFMTDSVLSQARKDMPKQVDDTLTEGSELLTKNQYLLKLQQNAEALVSKQGYFGYGVDQAKQLFQPYNELRERGQVGPYLEGIGLGSNIDAQHYSLYSKPMNEFKALADAAFERMKDNPSLAAGFFSSLRAQDTFGAALQNTFTAMAIPDALAAGKLGSKLVSRGARYNQVRRATQDMIEAAARDPNATPATRAEGAGDTAEAAVQRVSATLNDALQGKGDPIETAKQTLFSTWQDDARKFIQNPGTYLSRELTTRIYDSFSKDFEDLYNRFVSMNRVERTPVAVTDPDVIRAQKDKISTNYRGPANTLLDIEGPIREPVSGTYWWKSKIGNYDATQFADRETAEGFARTQLGMSEPVIKGAEAPKVYLPEAAAKNLQEIKTANGRTRFFMDNDIEVVPTTKPEVGHIPYNLQTQKFEPKLTAEQAHVEQQGLGFHIEVWSPMKENDSLVRDLMIKTRTGDFIPEAISTGSASGINKIKNSLLGWVRNSDDTLSVNESAQRKAATYSQANIHEWAKSLAKDLEDIANGRIREDQLTGEPLMFVHPRSWFGRIKNRQVAKQFDEVLDFARRMDDPSTGEPGYFFKTPGELQDHYQRNYHRDPSYLETKAYFNYTKLIEGDRFMREVAEFRNRARLGTEQHSIIQYDPKTGDKIQSNFFDGINQVEFPGGSDYILVLGKNTGDEKLYKLDHMNKKTRDSLAAKVKSGEGKAVQLYDRDQQPLSNFSEVAKDKHISYVYAEHVERKPLDFNHVARRGGGHFEWDYDFYLKQADVRNQPTGGNINDKRPGVENVYVGDKTIMPIKNRQMGQNVAKIWNEVHGLIKNDQWEQARPLVAKLGIDWERFTGWYHPGRDANGNPTRAMLNPHEPIVVVDRNRKIADMGEDLKNRYRFPKQGGGYHETFVDATKSGPANNFKVQYNKERNADLTFSTIADVGTEGNPIYQHQPAEMVDPKTTMNRALNRIINSTFMDDYKIYAVEHWLREAEPFFHTNISKNQIESSPFHYFNNPEWAPGADKLAINNLMSNRYKIQQFTGIPSKYDTWIHSVTAELADQFYTKMGPEGSRTLGQKAASIVPIYLLHRVTDPISFLRSVTFNFKLGLFAIPQFLVQAQTHSLIWALEPRHGTAGTYAMLLHGWSKFTDNPRILAKLDDYASKLNVFGSKFRPGEFLEARKEMANAGFEHVAGEYANINNQLKTRFILNDWEKGLKMGQYPFRMGEQSTRVTAWYTAFREFREANPTVPITNIERSKILAKADLLTVNMSRASASALNAGVFSLSTQFLTYQIKLAELFLGKRLGSTTTERNLARARIITLFTALYGLPNAIGVTGAPFSDFMREHFMDDLGYIPGEKWWSTMANEGLPAWSMAMITGKLPNVGDRFGSQGFENIKQALRGDIPWAAAVGGASVSTGYNFLSGLVDPYSQWIHSWLRGDNKDDRFRIKSADLFEPLKEISSYSMTSKWLTAINTGKWVSKNEQTVTDVNPLQATLLALTGMSPQEQDDMFVKNKMITGEEDAKKRVLKEYIKDWQRGIQAKSNDDPEQAIAYFKNARARAVTVGMSPQEELKAQAIAARGNQNAIDRSDYSDFTRGDYSQRDKRLQQFKRKLQLRDNQ